MQETRLKNKRIKQWLSKGVWGVKKEINFKQTISGDCQCASVEYREINQKGYSKFYKELFRTWGK